MAKIVENRRVGGDFWLMRAECQDIPRPGQFYMLRAWEKYPLLSRPVSVFDAGGGQVSFLYKVVGRGTRILSALGAGDEVSLDGPHGNGWPEVSGRVALVGGGVGIAPLYLAARRLGAENGGRRADAYLGFSDEAMLQEEYAVLCGGLTIDVGGFITDRINPEEYDSILACGPQIMMKVLYDKCVERGVGGRLWVSVENRMACGIGACLVCTCKTASGNKKACADGPVFKAEEVFGI